MIADLVADLILEVVVYPVRRAVERGGDWLLGRAKRLLGRGPTASDERGRESDDGESGAGGR